MASLFDYIQPQARPVTEEERRRREQLMMPLPSSVQAEQLPLGQLSDLRLQEPLRGSNPGLSQYDDSGLPQTPPAPMDPQRARLINQRQWTRGLQDYDKNPVVNNDRGWKGRLLDIGRQFLIRAGEAYNNGSGDPTQRLLGALGGGIVGGFEGGFDPRVDEKQQRLYDIRKSQIKEGEIEGQIQRDQQRTLTDARIADIPADNELRKLQIESVKRSAARGRLARDKYFDPTDARQIQDVMDAGLDPAKMVAFDDRNPKTVKLGNDLLQLNQTTGKWEIAGTRGDMVDYRLGDRVYRIPADKAAYNDTMIAMGAARIDSTNRNADNRIIWDREKTAKAQDLAERQFNLGAERFRTAKNAEERKEAMDLMNDTLTRLDNIVKNEDLDEETKNTLINLSNIKNKLFVQMTRP